MWTVAAMVTTLFVGTVAGAVYRPLEVSIEPVPVPVTDQFTSVLLAFKTVAVHCAVPNTVTFDPVPWVETQVAVMEGVTAVEAEPHELRIAKAAVSTKQKRRRSQRTLSRPQWKFGSNTRNPPARTPLNFPEEYTVSWWLLRLAHRHASEQTSGALTRPLERKSDVPIPGNASACR